MAGHHEYDLFYRALPHPGGVGETSEWRGSGRRTLHRHGQLGLGAIDEHGLGLDGQFDVQRDRDGDSRVGERERQVLQRAIGGQDSADEGSDDLRRVERRHGGVACHESGRLPSGLEQVVCGSVQGRDDVAACETR